MNQLCIRHDELLFTCTKALLKREQHLNSRGGNLGSERLSSSAGDTQHLRGGLGMRGGVLTQLQPRKTNLVTEGIQCGARRWSSSNVPLTGHPRERASFLQTRSLGPQAAASMTTGTHLGFPTSSPCFPTPTGTTAAGQKCRWI